MQQRGSHIVLTSGSHIFCTEFAFDLVDRDDCVRNPGVSTALRFVVVVPSITLDSDGGHTARTPWGSDPQFIKLSLGPIGVVFAFVHFMFVVHVCCFTPLVYDLNMLCYYIL